jgi:SAM-dependent methyltransferase
MSLRIKLARFLLRLSRFIQSLPVMVMNSDELVEFSRHSYAKPQDVDSWSEDQLVDSGLEPDELDLLKDLPFSSGKLLLLGVGGGREAIYLARKGFDITGVDYVPEMVARAKDNAARRGIQMDGLVQEISKLDVPPVSYDVVWISRAMYSCVPTRERRVEMVRRIAKALVPGGYFLCQFQRGQPTQYAPRGNFLRRLMARLTGGNTRYEPGDVLWMNVEFVHMFASDEELRAEIEAGGLEVLRIQKDINPNRGGAVCRKELLKN